MKSVRILALALLTFVVSAPARAQVQTGSITGIVVDDSNAVLPGVTVSLSGEKLIGGTQTQTTDATGSYRFDRLPPGTYRVVFELQGFKALERKDIVVDAANLPATKSASSSSGGGGEKKKEMSNKSSSSSSSEEKDSSKKKGGKKSDNPMDGLEL